MGGSISYAGIEDLNIDLGSGNDVFTIESTHSQDTKVEGRAGGDVFHVRTIAGPTP